MAPGNDHVDFQVLARCFRQRSALPGLICLEPGRNVSPATYLEGLTTNGKGPCPGAVVELLGLDHHVSVATAARILLDRLRSTGQLPATSTLAPVAVNVRDDVEGLAALARAFTAERPVPHQVRIGGGIVGTTLFLEGFAHDRRECPSSISSNAGVSNSPASMREVAASLLGRLRQARQLPVAINALDEVEGLAVLARAYQTGQLLPQEIRIGGARKTTTDFLATIMHDQRECPSSIAADVGVVRNPASMQEVSTALLDRLHQAGAK